MISSASSRLLMILAILGRVVIHSLNSPENYAFDMKRPMKAVALEPGFAKSSSKAFVCGGMAGTLVMHEKGWLGHKEHVLHSGEGPIYAIEWRGTLIAWANDYVSDALGQTFAAGSDTVGSSRE